MTVARLDRVGVRFGATVALPVVNLDVRAGEVLVVHGPSGSGKTTLLGVLAGWQPPTTGTVRWAPPLDGPDRWRWHRTTIVPQGLGLLPELSLAENVGIAHRLAGAPWPASEAAARAALATLGIGELGDRRPDEVSLGQQQRAAVARALTTRPALLLADEPSAHLDAATTSLVLGALRAAARDDGTAVVVASHDPVVLDAADRRVALGAPAVSRPVIRRRRPAAGTAAAGRPT